MYYAISLIHFLNMFYIGFVNNCVYQQTTMIAQLLFV